MVGLYKHQLNRLLILELNIEFTQKHMEINMLDDRDLSTAHTAVNNSSHSSLVHSCIIISSASAQNNVFTPHLVQHRYAQSLHLSRTVAASCSRPLTAFIDPSNPCGQLQPQATCIH